MPPPREGAAGQSTTAKVLVADDSEAERDSARTALSFAGYAVVEAVDGQHALEVFARERPDLVMLDVVMPRLTGLETCRILKAKSHASYLPVIMVSTRNSVNARVEGLRSGADDYLGKPYDHEELRARVEALLRTRKMVSDPPSPSTLHSHGEQADGPSDEAAFRRRLEEEFDRAERYSDPLACLRIEVDDYEGYPVDGNPSGLTRGSVTSQLRAVIESSIRKIDLVFPSNERGFVLALPNTHFPGALAVAERIWKDVERAGGAGRIGSRKLSVSVGVSFYPNRDTHSLTDLLDLVEAALTRARTEGGGKICLYQHQGYLYAPRT